MQSVTQFKLQRSKIRIHVILVLYISTIQSLHVDTIAHFNLA